MQGIGAPARSGAPAAPTARHSTRSHAAGPVTVYRLLALRPIDIGSEHYPADRPLDVFSLSMAVHLCRCGRAEPNNAATADAVQLGLDLQNAIPRRSTWQG